MKFLEDLRENTGYYYVDEEMNLNDLIMMTAFGLITIAIIIIEIIQYYKSEYMTQLITIIVYIGFCIPFLVHFIDKLIKMLAFRIKKNKFIKNGQIYRGRIVDSIRGKLLFKDSVSGKEKYSYYPVVEVCQGDIIYRFTSKSAVNNTAETALADRNVTLYCYQEDFILTEVNIADSYTHSIAYINSGNKAHYEKIRALALSITMIFLTGFAIINIIRLILKIITVMLLK